METVPAGFAVPLKVDIKTARTWADCKRASTSLRNQTRPRLVRRPETSPVSGRRSAPAWGFPDSSEALVRFPRSGAKTRKQTLAES